MHGIVAKKTFPADFEKIYPLLRDFDSPYSKEDWKRIFLYQWDGNKDYVGFHLEHDNIVVGFIGLIFSCRYKNNRQYQFCNVTSWIVKEAYRSSTILLVRKLNGLENTILTGLRPIFESYRLLTMVGFSIYESGYKIIPTINQFFNPTHKINVNENPISLNQLDAENKRILKDHLFLNCKSMLIQFNDTYCLLIYKITQQKIFKIPFKKIHLLYISDLTVFNDNICTILKCFRSKIGLFSALYVDNRFIRKKSSIFSFEKKINPPRIFYDKNNNEIDIDELYSEAVLL